MLVEELGSVVDRLYRRSQAERWGVSREEFVEALQRGVARAFPASHGDGALLGATLGDSDRRRAIEKHLESLRVEDLALACACATGRPAAWDHFVTTFRPGLYAAARAMTHDEASARGLADSIYGELFGMQERDGTRRSLFGYFHGRSSLSTWLRSVLAQRHVDLVRDSRRFKQFDDEDLILLESASEAPTAAVRAGRPTAAVTHRHRVEEPPAPDRARLVTLFVDTLRACIEALPPRERLRLSYYYRHARTLSEIGRLVGEHESSVSRALDRTRRALRAETERRLREEHRLGNSDIRQCYEDALSSGNLDLERMIED
jgi:RNA polymerase sigma-70 factor, ECF subfamily